MPIEFLCPQCHTLLETPDDSAGCEATCPRCGLALVVPRPQPVIPALDNLLGGSSIIGAPAGGGSASNPAVGRDSQTPRTPSSAAALPSPDQIAPPPLPNSAAADSAGSNSGSGSGSGSTSGSGDGSSSSSGVRQLLGIGVPLGPPEMLSGDLLAGDLPIRQPAPGRFTMSYALAFGWQIMLGNLLAFTLANFLLLVPALGCALIVRSQGLASAAGVLVTLIWLAYFPLLSVGLAHMAVRAARGWPCSIQAAFAGFVHFRRAAPLVWGWIVLSTICQFPFLLIWMILLAVPLPFVQFLGWLILLSGGIVIGIRLGWVPFGILDQPHASFGELLRQSMEASKGETLNLLTLALLTYSAMFGSGMLFGLPIAMGVGGGAYVLLSRAAARRTVKPPPPDAAKLPSTVVHVTV